MPIVNEGRGQKHTLNDWIHNNSFKAKVVLYNIQNHIKEGVDWNERIACGGHKMTINFPFIS